MESKVNSVMITLCDFGSIKAGIRSDRGVALFIVLWALVLLSVIVGEFCFATRSELKSTINFKEDTQAYYYARAGINAAIYEILKKQRTPKPEAGVDSEKDDNPKDLKWHMDGGKTTVPLESGKFTVSIENECGKVNINQAGEKLLRLMVGGFGLTDKEENIIVDSIIDWRDTDSFHRINGAESDFYQSLDQPYEAKNCHFDYISELLLVRGVTPEIYHGALKHLASVWDDPEITESTPFSPIQQYLTLKNQSAYAMQQFLTLESRSKIHRKDEVDYNRIDINSAPAQLLRALPGMDEYDVEAVVEARQKAAFTSVASLINIIGSRLYTVIVPYLAVQKSRFMTITSSGTLDNSPIYRTVRATIKIDDALENGFQILEWQDAVYERVVAEIPNQ